MLADAIQAETYRLSKNRTALFWSIGFVPIFALVMATLTYVFVNSKSADLQVNKMPVEIAGSGPLDLGASLVESAGGLANPVLLLFILIGAATVYAGDYRWETWRLISARNTRPNLLLGKVAVVALVTVVAMLAMLLSGFLTDLIKAAVFGRSLTFSMSGADAGQLLAQAGLSWLRIMQFTMIGLLAAALTRSLLAALFVPLVVAVGQFFLMQSLPLIGLTPDSWIAMLTLPGMAYDMLKATIMGGPAAAILPDGVALKATIGLALWTLAPLVAAIAWFNRQDLSKE